MGTNRKQIIEGLVKDAREFRLCGPSDDPDEQTAVTSGYYYLVVQFKRSVAPYLPEAVAARLNSIEVEINDIYSTYAAKAELDALIPDVEDALEQMDDKSIVRSSAHQSGFAGDDYKFARQAIEEARKSAPRIIAFTRKSESWSSKMGASWQRRIEARFLNAMRSLLLWKRN
jgi:hypothetical protein